MTSRPSPPLPAGRIEVLPLAIARIASRAAAAVDGVLGLAAPGAADPPALLAPAQAHRGASVRLGGGAPTVELFVIIRYGARVAQVAEAVRASAAEALDRALGGEPATVLVRVQGLRSEP